jgi:hypothetical protein
VHYARENSAAVKDILLPRFKCGEYESYCGFLPLPGQGKFKYYGAFIIVLLFDCGKSG